MKKRLGQHFISDRNLLQRIVKFAAIDPRGTVIEIGPGAGALTRELAEAARRVIAIEVDSDLIPELRANMPVNVEVVDADALQMDFARLVEEPAHVVGNLPYNVATPLLRKFIETRAKIFDVTVMLQREVAERIRAKPGSPDYGPLSLLIQYYATPIWGFTVSPGAFKPRPKVDSAVIRLEWRHGVADNPGFTDFVHRAFGSRRKKLLNNLTSMFPERTRSDLENILRDSGIDPAARAETLSLEAFLRVYNRLR